MKTSRRITALRSIERGDEMKTQTRHLVAVITVVLTLLCLGVSAAPAAAQGAWHAEYFASRDLAGSPALTRYEIIIVAIMVIF